MPSLLSTAWRYNANIVNSPPEPNYLILCSTIRALTHELTNQPAFIEYRIEREAVGTGEGKEGISCLLCSICIYG